MKLELDLFTPAEAEAITNVTQVTVRNWRRAGYLPRPEGHARYNIADVLVMFVMGLLVSRGTTPETAKEFSAETARAIFQSIIWSTRAFTEDVHDAARQEAVSIPEDKVDLIKAAVGDAFDMEKLESFETLDRIVKAAEQAFGVSGIKRPEWLVIWADDTMEFFYAEDASESFFGNIEYGEAYVQGPVIMFCLGALAQMVIDRLPRPAIRLARG